MYALITNKEKIRQGGINGLFQFTCGHIRPILGSVETKDNGQKNCWWNQGVESKGKGKKKIKKSWEYTYPS